ncbi:MAG: epoxyqueuosine reductase [candidate division Zixibacteria bacterium]|nr:epoxyqueuosine reductase [candidate division Zixibacteria bacterium]
MDANGIKEIAIKLGADLCGIAPVKRFDNAPDGFRPVDIYAECQSILVFAKRLPTTSLFASSCVPYSHVNDLITREVDSLTLQISLKLEDIGINNVLIPSDDPYEHWESEKMYGRAILSLRHAGMLAGLGKLGQSTLLINDRYGNMIQIGATLLNVELAGDSLADYEVCPDGCDLCLDSCPQAALNGETVNQLLCRPFSNFITPKGYNLKKCNLCRSICPSALGIEG